MLGTAGLINVSGAARFHVEHAHLTTDHPQLRLGDGHPAGHVGNVVLAYELLAGAPGEGPEGCTLARSLSVGADVGRRIPSNCVDTPFRRDPAGAGRRDARGPQERPSARRRDGRNNRKNRASLDLTQVFGAAARPRARRDRAQSISALQQLVNGGVKTGQRGGGKPRARRVVSAPAEMAGTISSKIVTGGRSMSVNFPKFLAPSTFGAISYRMGSLRTRAPFRLPTGSHLKNKSEAFFSWMTTR
jgi:hypothetical protein